MNRCCYPTTFLNGLCARTDTRDHKGQRLRKTSFYGVVHMKKNKTNKLKNVFNHLQLGHVPLTFFLQADSQLKFGRRGLAALLLLAEGGTEGETPPMVNTHVPAYLS